MKYPLAERFLEIQGEGLFAGTPMAFMRLVGCSVGHKVCTACDTDFDTMRLELDGGLYEVADLVDWVTGHGYRHACLTGGEPLDRNLAPLIHGLRAAGCRAHVETSGTARPAWLNEREHRPHWVCVSPKPGWRQDMIDEADEVKVILGGLGDGPGWPTVDDAVRWAEGLGKLVYVQQKNNVRSVDHVELAKALAVVRAHPSLRLSVQLHKFLGVR